jgi:hypothetical protein
MIADARTIERRSLDSASRRANQETPTTYTPTANAKAHWLNEKPHNIATPSSGRGQVDIPNKTLSERQLPITIGPTQNRLSAKS